MKRKELTDKLTLVGMALAKNDLVPVFQCFDFSNDRVTAYNDELGIEAVCELSTSFITKGDVLLGLLSNSHADTVEVTSDPGGIAIKAGRSTFKLPTALREDWLFEVPKLGKAALQFPIDDNLIAGLKACLLTSSTDNAQPAFMGVCLAAGERYKILYSTDGDAISRFVLTGEPTKKAKFDSRVMPNSFCEALVKIAEETEAKKGTMLFDDQWASAYLDTGYFIHGRLLHIDNPLNYEKELSTTRPGIVSPVDIPKGLELALSRARVLADPESAKTVLMVAEGRLKLITETHLGVVRDSIQFKHPDVKASVSAQLLQRCIGLCDMMYIRENCIEFWGRSSLYILTSNMGE